MRSCDVFKLNCAMGKSFLQTVLLNYIDVFLNSTYNGAVAAIL
jgi:hypothetical protein